MGRVHCASPTNGIGREISNYRDFPFWNSIPRVHCSRLLPPTLIRSKAHRTTHRENWVRSARKVLKGWKGDLTSVVLNLNFRGGGGGGVEWYVCTRTCDCAKGGEGENLKENEVETDRLTGVDNDCILADWTRLMLPYTKTQTYRRRLWMPACTLKGTHQGHQGEWLNNAHLHCSRGSFGTHLHSTFGGCVYGQCIGWQILPMSGIMLDGMGWVDLGE